LSQSAFTLNSVSFYVNAAATSPSTCYLALYNTSGTQLATSADFSSTLGTNAGVITVSLTSSYSIAANTLYYIGFLIGNGTTTSPTLIVSSTTLITNAGATTPTANTLNGGARTLSLGTSLTALPSPISGTASLSGAHNYWFGLK
jgi:hypothetical protein